MESQETALQDNYSSSMATGKLDAYLADCNVNNSMQFWQENINKFPKLYQLHLKHHCIPATSAAMERCSSALCSWIHRECSAIQADWSDVGLEICWLTAMLSETKTLRTSKCSVEVQLRASVREYVFVVFSDFKKKHDFYVFLKWLWKNVKSR